MKIILSLIMIFVLAAVENTNAGTLCVDPADGSCLPTIQAAVDAALADDIIEVRPTADGSPYSEVVTVSTSGLTIQGSQAVSFPVQTFEDLMTINWLAERQLCPTITVDACGTPGNPDTCGENFSEDIVFIVTAPDVTIERLTISHGHRGIRLESGADNATIQDNCFINSDRAFVAGSDDTEVHNATVRQNRIFAQDSSPQFNGNMHTFELNLFHISEGLLAHGNQNTFNLNAVWLTTDQAGVEAIGDLNVITNNYMRGMDKAGILALGAQITIDGNHIETTPDTVGIWIGNANQNSVIQSDDVTIINNTIIGTAHSGIELDADNSLVQNNTIEAAGLSRSSEEDVIRPAGIWIKGRNNEILNNDVSRGGAAGIQNGGEGNPANRNVYSGNIVSLNASSGILLLSGTNNEVSNNQLLDNEGEGLNNLAGVLNTRIDGNTITGNYRDVCNCGHISSFEGNTLNTGGIDAACVVEKNSETSCNGVEGLLIDGFE